MSSPSNNDVHEFMSKFDADLIHRVLLTDKKDFINLSMSGLPRVERTPSFEEFVDQYQFTSSKSPSPSSNSPTLVDQISLMMRKAYHNMVIEAIIGDPHDFEPLKKMILELHFALRSLIPNRADLHAILSDDDVKSANNSNSAEYLILHLTQTGQALIQLESENRASSTLAWVKLSQSVSEQIRSSDESKIDVNSIISNFRTMPGMTYAVFMVASAAYLNTKAEMCQSDVADFKLGHILAPKIKAHGINYERSIFKQQFGDFDDSCSAPATREWIRQTIINTPLSVTELHSSEEKRATALYTSGWIDEIVFRLDKGGTQPFLLPEIFRFDKENIKKIRDLTRVSVIGSTLVLHTSMGKYDSIMRKEVLPRNVQNCRSRLAQAMQNRSAGDQEKFEEGIFMVILDLAKLLNPSFNSEDEVSLRNRTSAVIKSDEPVKQLLHNRMRSVFHKMVLWQPPDNENLPIRIKTGRDLVNSSRKVDESSTFESSFLSVAKKEFIKSGFVFYADELAGASLIATKVINLAMMIFGSPLIDPVFLQECNRRSQLE